MFTLMGLFLGSSGLGRKLFRAFNAWLGHIRGGLAIASIASCAFFAAVSGSVIGTAATIGKIAGPEMISHKYKETLAAGAIASGGTLGILIPPSSVLIIYGAITEESIGQLLIAGIIPGILTALLLACTAWLQVRLNPELAPTGIPTPFKERLRFSKDIWPIPVIFLISMSGIYLGVFTPNEGGAVGAFLSFLYAVISKQMNKNAFNEALVETANITAMIFGDHRWGALWKFSLGYQNSFVYQRLRCRHRTVPCVAGFVYFLVLFCGRVFYGCNGGYRYFHEYFLPLGYRCRF